MTKEEQLKIYSAYLPYGLKIGFEGEDHEHSFVGLELSNEGVLLISPYGDFGRADVEKCKPILWDLSYLTKEIEGGFYVINEIADVISADQDFSIIQDEERIILDFEEEHVFHLISLNNMMRQPYEIIQILLKYHFNVFGLPEDQFINKATLTTNK